MQAKSKVPGSRSRSRRRPRSHLAPLPNPELEAAKAQDAEHRARARLAAAAATGAPLLNATGSPRSPITLPEYRRGRAPANKGKRYPAEVLTPTEIGALLDALHDGASGVRTRALIVLLWRSGLRVAEALALRPEDIDLEQGAITVLRGKGAKRRVVAVDPVAIGYLRDWLAARSALQVPTGALVFCTVSRDAGGPGRPVSSSSFREQLKLYAHKAGIRKRVHPHGLRHTHAYELANEAVPLHVIQAQLGHASLTMTSHYIDHLAPQQVLAAIAARSWPAGTVAAPATRVAASQGVSVPLAEPGIVPAYSPVPSEPPADPVERAPGLAGPPGEAKRKLLRVLRTNGGRATQAQLARALGVRNLTVRRHCEQLAAIGAVVRLGELERPASGGRPLVVWGLPPLRAVFELDHAVELGRRARPGRGAERVLEAIRQLGGRSSQAKLAGLLGISSNTVATHCRALAARGLLEKGGLDKSSSNRGSQTWAVPARDRYGTPAGPRLQLAAGSSSTGLSRRRR